MKDSRHFLVRKSHCADGESKGTRRDARESKVPFLANAASRSSMCPSRSSLTRAEKTKFPFWSTTVPLMVPNDSAGFWPPASCAAGTAVVGASGKGVSMLSNPLCLRQKRKAREQDTERMPSGSPPGTERQPAPLESVARGS